MPRAITFQRRFPGYHPKGGASTFFVEQILNTLGINYRINEYFSLVQRLNQHKIDDGRLTTSQLELFYTGLNPAVHGKKKHTMRESFLFSAGKLFSPAVWSAVPYYSPQIIFAPDTTVTRIIHYTFSKNFLAFNRDPVPDALLYHVAQNDGLTCEDLKNWFRQPDNFSKGSLIAWDNNLLY